MRTRRLYSSLIAIVFFLERIQARGVESDTTDELPGSSCGDFFAPIRCLRDVSPSASRWRARASEDSNLLDCLDTSQLEELYCSSQSNHLSSLFKRRPPQRLRKLVLFFPASVPDISGILHSAPTITDLGVCVPAESFDELNTSLILRNEPTDVGLALRSIFLACNERLGQILFRRYNQHILIVMLISRWRAGAGELRSINVDSEFDMRDERLGELESEGLVFTSYDAHIGMVPEHLQFESSYW
ncbi:hypothetical protein B0H14DRAFT_3883587 [Mycena olivaceomarginata]|nr:hypothetical protein B0H14DRAFT_3883587 [Mycena olivaceomarginata]